MRASAGPAERRSVARHASVVGLAVLSSRLMGLVREQVFAAFFGAGAVFDAFVAAFRIPNLFRDLLAEGALSAAFVRTFTERLERHGIRSAHRLANAVFAALLLVVGILVLLGVAAAPWLVNVLAPGFDAHKAELATSLARVMFPFLLFVSLGAVSMGLLNARDRFGVPAMASTFFNFGSVVSGLLFAWLIAPEPIEAVARALLRGDRIPRDVAGLERAIFGMAFGTLVGGALQFGVQVPSLLRVGFRWELSPDLRDPGLRKVLALMAPALVGVAATQINVFVNTNFASRLEDGAVSWLNYAFRLMQFPIGVFGVAVATATLPAVSRSAARGREEEFRRTVADSVRLGLFLTVPSAVGLVVLREPIVALLYERGSFTPADTQRTAQALAAYALGLVGYSLVKILAPCFYAVDDARTPARVAVLSIFTNVLLCALLVRPLGHAGLALSTALVASLNAALLFALLRRRVGPLHGRRLVSGLWRIAAASAVVAWVSLWGFEALSGVFPEARTSHRLVCVLGAVAAGALSYLAAATALGMEEARRLIGLGSAPGGGHRGG